MTQGGNPRGPEMWPEWRKAKGGERVAHVRSGRTGTFRRWPKTPPRRAPGYAVIQWDHDALGRSVEPGTGVTGRVVAYPFDLKPLKNIQ